MSYLKYRLQMEDREKILYFKAREAFPFGKTRSRKKKKIIIMSDLFQRFCLKKCAVSFSF